MFSQTHFVKRLSMLAFLLMGVFACVFYFVDISLFDLNSGFSHPLEGWDHIVTMLGVGIWAAQLRGKAIWLLPTTFVSVMSLGGISGAAKYLAVPSAEILIVLSCLVFSVLIIRKVRFDTRINVLIVAFFAFFHGYAHGAEISASASLISYTLGFMVATLLLHGAGILVAKVILLSIAFFFAQALHIFTTNENVKTVTASYSQIAHVDAVQQDTFKVEDPPPLVNFSPQWLNLSPPLERILQILTLLKNYFQLAALLCVFFVSQFFCYVFYPKQDCVCVCFAKFLCRFKKVSKLPILFLTLARLSYFFRIIFQPNFYLVLSCVQKNRTVFTIQFRGISMKSNIFKSAIALFLLAPNFAYAHSMAFTAIDLSSGFLHPLQGFDHIVAMLAVGFWATQLRGVAMWVLPLTFVSVMTLGGLLGTSGFELDYAETFILVSGFVLSILAVKNVQFDLKVSALIVGFFALFHGFAHGAEISDSADLISYSVGFICATSVLHLAGIGLARTLHVVKFKRSQI